MVKPVDEDENLPPVIDLTRDQSWAELDAECRAYLGIGVEEFARRYHTGEYDDPDDDRKVMWLAMQLEFLERNPPQAWT